MQYHLKEIMVDDVVTIMFGDVKIIIPNQMTIMWGDMKRKNSSSFKKSESSCYRCGMINHWSRTCRTLKHLVELTKHPSRKKGKEVETNFIENESSGLLMDTHPDVSDFFENVDKEINIMN
jgi:hypothetical protein